MNGSVAVRTIQISDVVTPYMLYAKLEEEIRGQRLRARPIRVGVRKGRGYLWGQGE